MLADHRGHRKIVPVPMSAHSQIVRERNHAVKFITKHAKIAKAYKKESKARQNKQATNSTKEKEPYAGKQS